MKEKREREKDVEREACKGKVERTKVKKADEWMNKVSHCRLRAKYENFKKLFLPVRELEDERQTAFYLLLQPLPTYILAKLKKKCSQLNLHQIEF